MPRTCVDTMQPDMETTSCVLVDKYNVGSLDHILVFGDTKNRMQYCPHTNKLISLRFLSFAKLHDVDLIGWLHTHAGDFRSVLPQHVNFRGGEWMNG